MKAFFIALLVVLISFGFTIQPDDWQIFEKDNYSISYPSDWKLDQSGLMGTTFFVMSPLESEKDEFKENVNLLVQDLTGYDMDLDKYTALSEKQVKTMITHSKLIESKRMTNTAGGEYQKIIYTGDQGVLHLKFEQYYWVINNKAYVLTLTCEKKSFKKYKATGEKILDSFVIK